MLNTICIVTIFFVIIIIHSLRGNQGIEDCLNSFYMDILFPIKYSPRRERCVKQKENCVGQLLAVVLAFVKS